MTPDEHMSKVLEDRASARREIARSDLRFMVFATVNVFMVLCFIGFLTYLGK